MRTVAIQVKLRFIALNSSVAVRRIFMLNLVDLQFVAVIRQG